MSADHSSPALIAGAFDLTFQRVVPVTAAQLWQGWTNAETLKQWFTPAPWKTIDAEIDPRPGGVFRTVMRGPNGETGGGGVGCVLDAVPNERFVWTTALGPGYTPNAVPDGGFHFTGKTAKVVNDWQLPGLRPNDDQRREVPIDVSS